MITKIHPFDMFKLLHELSVEKMVTVKRDTFGVITVDDKDYEQTTDVTPTDEGLEYLAAREPELAALYRSGLPKEVKEVEALAESDVEVLEPLVETPAATETSAE